MKVGVGIVVFTVALAVSAISGAAQSAKSATSVPATGPLIQIDDVERFYKVYDAAGGHPTADLLQHEIARRMLGGTVDAVTPRHRAQPEATRVRAAAEQAPAGGDCGRSARRYPEPAAAAAASARRVSTRPGRPA